MTDHHRLQNLGVTLAPYQMKHGRLQSYDDIRSEDIAQTTV